MRKLTYDIFTKDGIFVNNVASFAQVQEAKTKGYTTKVKMIEVKEQETKEEKERKLARIAKINKIFSKKA